MPRGSCRQENQGIILVETVNLYGSGTISSIIREIITDSGRQLGQIYDDDQSKHSIEGIMPGIASTGIDSFRDQKNPFVISIGNNLVRKKIAECLPVSFTNAIHPSVLKSKTVKVGEGTIILHGSIVQAGTTLGKHVLINTAASIDHHCVIGDYAHVSPHATLSGLVNVGEQTHIGAGATIIERINIGKCCIIGAGAVVIRDVPDHTVVVGNPARVLRRTSLEST